MVRRRVESRLSDARVLLVVDTFSKTSNVGLCQRHVEEYRAARGPDQG